MGRLIGTGVALTFLWTSVFLPLPSGWAKEVSLPSFLTLSHLQIPPDLGTLEEIYNPRPSVRRPHDFAADGMRHTTPFIIHIQTAHGSYEVQKKVAALLRYLRKKYAVQILLVEGAVGELEPALDRYFQNSRWNRQVLEYRARRGQTSGVSLFLLDAPASVRALGALKQPTPTAKTGSPSKIFGPPPSGNRRSPRFELFHWFRFLQKMIRQILGLRLTDPALQKVS